MNRNLSTEQFWDIGRDEALDLFRGHDLSPVTPITGYSRASRWKETPPGTNAMKVRGDLLRPEFARDAELDPREVLRATQPNLTRQAISHYTHPQASGTFAPAGRGNDKPTIYVREETDPHTKQPRTDHIILSGHHRAASALYLGRPLEARIIDEREHPPPPNR